MPHRKRLGCPTLAQKQQRSDMQRGFIRWPCQPQVAGVPLEQCELWLHGSLRIHEHIPQAGWQEVVQGPCLGRGLGLLADAMVPAKSKLAYCLDAGGGEVWNHSSVTFVSLLVIFARCHTAPSSPLQSVRHVLAYGQL